MVKWSACSSSTLTIRVRILLTPTVFSVKFEFKKKQNEQKEAGIGPFKKQLRVSSSLFQQHYCCCWLDRAKKPFICDSKCWVSNLRSSINYCPSLFALLGFLLSTFQLLRKKLKSQNWKFTETFFAGISLSRFLPPPRQLPADLRPTARWSSLVEEDRGPYWNCSFT